MDAQDVVELLETQVESQGVACLTVSDGHVMMFPLETLERLVERAREKGKAIIFIKTGVPS